MGKSAARAELLLDRYIGSELETELVAMFDGFGFDTESRRELAHRDLSDLGWLVLAALPLQGFLTAIGEQAVKEIYSRVKKLGRHKEKRALEDRRPPLVLQDADSGLQIVLEDDLPAEAYQKLIGLDLTAFRKGPLHYDRHQGAWRSELDEAAD